MNARLLFAITVIASTLAGLVSTAALAQAGHPLPTRHRVQAEVLQAAANGSLRRNDYDADSRAASAATSTRTRAEVVGEMRAGSGPKVAGSAASRNDDPLGQRPDQASTLARAEVEADLRRAMSQGRLQRSDYDVDSPRAVRRAPTVVSRPVLAGSVKPAAPAGAGG